MKNKCVGLVAVTLLMTGCATAPLVTSNAAFATPVASDRAFDAAVAAGTDLGFIILKGPAPDRATGYVGFIVGSSSGKEVAKQAMLLPVLFTHEFILQVQLRKEGELALGADLTANRTGFGEFTKEQEVAIQGLFVAYRDALKTRLQEGAK